MQRIASAASVVLVNGEKAVRALHQIGVVATCKSGGEQGADKVDWSFLYGKTVILWSDNDDKGRAYMEQVRDLLSPHCTVKWIDPTKYGLKPKDDAYDWIEQCTFEVDGEKIVNKEIVFKPIENAESCGASAGLFNYLGDIASGRIKNISMGWDCMARYTQFCIPGTVTFICGQGGDGKSLMTTQGMQHLHENKIRWCMYELEDAKHFHLARALAQRVGNADITDFEEMLGKDDYVKGLQLEHRDWADSFGRHIWTRP